MHVLSIESHNSSTAYRDGLRGLKSVLREVTSIEEALTLEIPQTIHDELSFLILGYSGKDKEIRYCPLYDNLPSPVKLSLYTQQYLEKRVFIPEHKMARFLTNSRRMASVILLASYAGWPEVTDSQSRLEKYTEYGSWLYKGVGEVPPFVTSFCTEFNVDVRTLRRWPLDLLFGSPRLRSRFSGKVQLLDAVNCAATPSYDLVSLSRPPLHSLIENWRNSK